MLQNDNVVYSFRGPLGVQVDIGSSIVFLVGLIMFINLSGSLLNGAILVGILVTSIYLHELGHAWGNKVQGIPVRRIMLHGGGGFCQAAKAGTPRQQELVVAMGPLVNLALWAIAGLLNHMLAARLASSAMVPGVTEELWLAQNGFYVSLYYWIGTFGLINLALFCFNLIPVQPLDGGKLFHLLMLRFTDTRTAYRIAGGVGLVASVLWIPAAIWVFVTVGWVLFFFPSIPLHWAMAQGRAAF